MSKVVKAAGKNAGNSRAQKIHGSCYERGALKKTTRDVNDEKPRGFLSFGKNDSPPNRNK